MATARADGTRHFCQAPGDVGRTRIAAGPRAQCGGPCYYWLPSLDPGGAADGGGRPTDGPDQARRAGGTDVVFGKVAAARRPAPTDGGTAGGDVPEKGPRWLLPAEFPGSRRRRLAAPGRPGSPCTGLLVLWLGRRSAR